MGSFVGGASLDLFSPRLIARGPGLGLMDWVHMPWPHWALALMGLGAKAHMGKAHMALSDPVP